MNEASAKDLMERINTALAQLDFEDMNDEGLDLEVVRLGPVPGNNYGVAFIRRPEYGKMRDVTLELVLIEDVSDFTSIFAFLDLVPGDDDQPTCMACGGVFDETELDEDGCCTSCSEEAHTDVMYPDHPADGTSLTEYEREQPPGM